MLQTTLLLLIIFPIIGLIVGLIKPAWALPKVPHPSRKKVIFIYIVLFIAVFALTAVIGSNKELILNVYKDEKRMKISHGQVFQKLERDAKIEFSPPVDGETGDYPLFGEQKVILQDKDDCYTIRIDKRYDEARSIMMTYHDVFNENDSTCTDKLVHSLILLENVFGKGTDYYEAIRGMDEVIAKAQQTGKSQTVEKTVLGKMVKISLFPNIRTFTIDISAE